MRRSVLALLGVFIAFSITVVAFIVHPARSYTVADLAAASTVMVEAGTAHGSGVVIGKNLVLTAKHVADAGGLTIHLPNGKQVNGHVLRSSHWDAALIVADTGATPYAPINCERTHMGDEVVAFGNPLKARNVAVWGRVAGNEITQGELMGYVPLDMTILPGNSGGGIWSTAGHIVGLSNAVVSHSGLPTGIGLMKPMSSLCPFIYSK
jgi:serine protease Do